MRSWYLGPAIRWKLALGVSYVAALVARALIALPLGHDESVYALGGDFTPMQLHRPVGMHLIAAPGVLAGGGELGFRLTAMAGILGFLAAAWLFARRTFGPSVAGWTVIVVATSFAVLHRGVELLPDAPAGALGLLYATVLVDGLGPRETPGPERRWRLIALGPLAAASFYVRYGSVVVLVAMALTALVVFRRRVRANLAPLAVAGGLLAVLAIPHVLHSLDATGSAFGIIDASRVIAGRRYVGDGLVFYLTTWWGWLGPAATVCVAAGLLAAAARRPFTDGRDRELATFAAGAAGLTIVWLGLVAHGEARFMFVPQVLATTVGVAALRQIAPRRRLAIALVAVSAAGCIAASMWQADRARRTFAVIAAAGRAVRTDAAGQPCRVVCGQWAQIAWYSGCASMEPPPAILPAHVGGLTYLVWFERTQRRQPPAVVSRVLAGRDGVRAREVARAAGTGLLGGATIYRLELAAPTARP